MLYSLTPKGFPPSVRFEPVPIALAVYALFTVARFVLALRRRLPDWFLSLSVVADITLLMVTIWSFHLQYQAPPAIYFKAPTLMYAFIFIALRTLRFEPRFVVLAGASAAIGWIVLVGYALWFTEGVHRTHSFADYAMSNNILLGAEFDKIVSILMVTAILALALCRARALLARAVTEQQAAAGLARFFAPEIAGRIASELELAPGQAELREAAILFVDLRGFTPLAERLAPGQGDAPVVGLSGADGARDPGRGWQRRQVHGRRHPRQLRRHRAIGCLCRRRGACAEGVVAAAAAWAEARRAAGEEPLAVGAALAAGSIMFGTVGDAERLEYTVIGEPVNLAAKLEKHSKAERATAVVPVAVLELAAAQGQIFTQPWQRRPARQVAGLAAPIDLAVVMAQ